MENNNFGLTDEEWILIKKWKSELPFIEPDIFGIEYQYYYTFYPTGLGMIKKVKRIDGEELDLTNYKKW